MIRGSIFIRVTRGIARYLLRLRSWVAGWVGGWLAGCHMPVIYKTAKTILKLFRPSGSYIILVFSDPSADIQFQGELLQRGYKYTGVGKIGDFRLKSPFISETVRDRPMVTMER